MTDARVKEQSERTKPFPVKPEDENRSTGAGIIYFESAIHETADQFNDMATSFNMTLLVGATFPVTMT